MENTNSETETSNAQMTLPSNVVTKQYLGQMIFNLTAFAIMCVILYVLPWGKFDSGSPLVISLNNIASNPFTGFNLGSYNFAVPLTGVNLILLWYIINNNLKQVVIFSIVGLLAASNTCYNTHEFVIKKSPAGVVTGFCYLLPLIYIILIVYNIDLKKNIISSKKV